MNRMLLSMTLMCSLTLLLTGCRKEEPQKPAQPRTAATAEKNAESKTHTHADGSTHEDHKETDKAVANHDHAHDEVPLGSITMGDMKVELAQGHGKVEAGKEGHLVVKLPYSDKGATIVRAWIGTEDRTMSQVGKGAYAPAHDDYDVHAVAPNPLPENVMWWIEIQKPDDTKIVGSIKPL